MAYQHIKVPGDGKKITLAPIHKLNVPDQPIIPFIEGDGTGPDIWRASQYVFDNAVKKVYGGKRKIAWMEVFAGEKPFKDWKEWLPDETVEPSASSWSGSRDRSQLRLRRNPLAQRGIAPDARPLRMPAPVRYFTGVPSPVSPEDDDVEFLGMLDRTRDAGEIADRAQAYVEVEHLAHATLSERIPPPIGVVSGPLIPTRNSRKASTVSSGSHSFQSLNGFSPAKTSIHAILRLPP